MTKKYISMLISVFLILMAGTNIDEPSGIAYAIFGTLSIYLFSELCKDEKR